VALLASILPGIYFVLLLWSVFSASKPPRLDGTLLIAILLTVVGLVFGLRLIRGKRRLVLFLRKFGFTQATKALTFAVVRSLGSSWRLITLDDAEVSPVGTQKRFKWLSVGMGLIGMAILAWGLTWIFGGGLDRLLKEATRNTFGQPTLRELLPRLIGAFVVGLIAGVLGLIFILLPTTFFGALAVFGWVSYGASIVLNGPRR
jgi:hypothetical protein